MLSVSEQLDELATFKPAFKETIGEAISAHSLKIFQINVGRWCNQACRHCHVDASPKRTESMSDEVLNACIDVIEKHESIETVDITGGAPEGHPRFMDIVKAAKAAGKHVIDRCNLTILEEPGFEYLYGFLSENDVEIIASLPHFAKARTDSQRGQGVFDKSIIAMKKLNEFGYGKEKKLSLVYNPSGLFLSGSQEQLEREYKENLHRNYGIEFNNLFCLNNLPVNRFLNSLVKAGKLNQYMDLLCSAYNAQTVPNLMCRSQISVAYDGSVYDCDFNQMLEMKAEQVSHILDFDMEKFLSRKIVLANHCYGCTAGAGSSCGGELV